MSTETLETARLILLQIDHNRECGKADKFTIEEVAEIIERRVVKNNDLLHSVTKRWLFWFESEGKDGWTFTIKAKNSDEAYDLAYEEYGPQVEGMMYQEI